MVPIEKFKVQIADAEVYDIPTMHKLSDEQYRALLRDESLIFVDSHDILRASIGEYPIATKLKQLDILIEELQRLRREIASRSGT